MNADTEALRTRPEDQVLPDGDESIADDQSLVIADIEERRQVGVSRYGQGHRPFNGRDTLLDGYQEILDLLVYWRSLLRASEAERDALVLEVSKVLMKELPDLQPLAAEAVANVAVTRIMGWVATQREGELLPFVQSLAATGLRAVASDPMPTIGGGSVISRATDAEGWYRYLADADQRVRDGAAAVLERVGVEVPE